MILPMSNQNHDTKFQQAPARPSGISNSISSSPAPPPQQMSTVQRLSAPTQPPGGGNPGGGGGGGGQISGLSPEDQSTVQKCKNFLMTLIQLAQRNDTANPQTVHNVKELVQQLIDNSITAEAFTERLQTELQSSPQVCYIHWQQGSILGRIVCIDQSHYAFGYSYW